MKLFDEHFDTADKPAWAIDAENTLSGLFHYWIKNRPTRPSMNEYLVDTEIRWRLAEYRRAIYDRERKKVTLLKLKLTVFLQRPLYKVIARSTRRSNLALLAGNTRLLRRVLLAMTRRAFSDVLRSKTGQFELKEKIQDFITALYVLKIKRGLSHER